MNPSDQSKVTKAELDAFVERFKNGDASIKEAGDMAKRLKKECGVDDAKAGQYMANLLSKTIGAATASTLQTCETVGLDGLIGVGVVMHAYAISVAALMSTLKATFTKEQYEFLAKSFQEHIVKVFDEIEKKSTSS